MMSPAEWFGFSSPSLLNVIFVPSFQPGLTSIVRIVSSGRYVPIFAIKKSEELNFYHLLAAVFWKFSFFSLFRDKGLRAI